MPRVVGHITALIRMDIGVTARSICMVVHRFDGGALLLWIVKLSMHGRTHLTALCETARRWFVHFRVTAMVKLNVCITTSAISVINSGFTRNLENLASVHIK